MHVKRSASFDVDVTVPTRHTSVNYSKTGFNSDVTSEKYHNEVERSLIFKGLDMDEGITIFRKFVGQLKTEIHELKNQNDNK